jgi:prefoldin subunit 5
VGNGKVRIVSRGAVMSDEVYAGEDRRHDDRRSSHQEVVTDVLAHIGAKLFWGLMTIGFSLIVVIGSGVAAWTSLKSDVAVLGSELRAIAKIVETGTKDRYHAKTAEKDFELRDNKIQFLQEQVDKIKHELDAHHAMPAHTIAIIEHQQFKAHMADERIHQKDHDHEDGK